jgi:hypothetical protein
MIFLELCLKDIIAATRIRTLKIYTKHNQKNAIDFIDHVESKFHSEYIPLEPIADTNFRPNFTGMLKIRE